jgi:putative hydrolase
MVAGARSLGRAYVAVTDHSQALTIANGMSADELVEQGRAIDAMNRGFEGDGDPFRVLRSMEVDLFADGSLDMDDASLASLDLVLGVPLCIAGEGRPDRALRRRAQAAAVARARAAQGTDVRAACRPGR